MTAVAPYVVMPGHGRPKDGVALLAYVPGIHVAQGARQSAGRAWSLGKFSETSRKCGTRSRDAVVALLRLRNIRTSPSATSGTAVATTSAGAWPDIAGRTPEAAPRRR
jgi:hypothetical protein